METIKRIIANPWVAGALGLVAGVFIGLVILGWWLVPVQWTDAAPADLRADAKVSYLRACIDAYGYNGDAARAKACYDSLGTDAPAALQEIVENPAAQDTKLVAAFGSLALSGGELTGETGQQPQVGSLPVTTPGAIDQTAQAGLPEAGSTVVPLSKEGAQEPATGSSSRSWITFICAGGLILAAIGAALALLNRFGVIKLGGSRSSAADNKAQPGEYSDNPDDVPSISRNIASYQIGNDLFDEVYSIEVDGDFLGEYGVAIADFSGVGGPKKVSAFEVWLFDKNHIPTTTKVLMSDQAFADANRRQKLEAKGETLLAEIDRPVILETNTLRLVTRIVNMSYGQGAAGNYFERFVLDLKVWQVGD
jgi:hypothetical protein